MLALSLISYLGKKLFSLQVKIDYTTNRVFVRYFLTAKLNPDLVQQQKVSLCLPSMIGPLFFNHLGILIRKVFFNLEKQLVILNNLVKQIMY